MKALLLFLLVLGGSGFAKAAESMYDGKPESYWINTLTNKNAAAAFARLGDEQVRVLVKALSKQDGPDAAVIRTNAEEILEEILMNLSQVSVLSSLAEDDSDPDVRKSAIGIFVGWLEHSNASIRSVAAGYLRELPEGWEAVYVRLRKALKNPDPLIRKAAAEALRAGAREQMENVIDIFDAESFYTLQKQDGQNWDVTVKVVDETGAPIEGAEVWFPWRDKRDWESANPSGASARWAEFGRTGRDGLCKFSKVGYVASVNIHAGRSGYTSKVVECRPPFSEEMGGPAAGKRVVPTITFLLKKTTMSPDSPEQKVGR